MNEEEVGEREEEEEEEETVQLSRRNWGDQKVRVTILFYVLRAVIDKLE